MLDSGAYSAWAKGESIDIDSYITYIKKHEHLLYSYVNLDQIPGIPDRPRNMQDVEASAKASYANFKKMKKAGLNPIPVFHRGERWYWLEKMLDEGEGYVGVSPSSYIVGVSTAQEWLDKVFTRLTDKDGKALVKVHGFAVASFDLLKRYPWFTCDATSWALTAAYGGLYMPLFKKGQPDYSEVPIKLSVSVVERGSGTTANDHYTRFGPMMRKQLEQFLSEVGVTLEAASKDYEVRARAIVYFMLKFQEAVGDPPFRHRTMTLI